MKIELGLQVEDFYRKPYTVKSLEELYDVYKLSEEQRIEHSAEKMRKIGASVGVMEPDEFSDWLIRRGICPHGVISSNSRYHFENAILLDNDMGLTLPDQSKPLGDTPSLFFQALNLVRSAKAKVREEEKQNAPHNSN